MDIEVRYETGTRTCASLLLVNRVKRNSRGQPCTSPLYVEYYIRQDFCQSYRRYPYFDVDG